MKTARLPVLAFVLLWIPASIPAWASDSRNTRAPGSGSVLTLDYTGRASDGIAIADFLYFIPLISPEPVSASESPTNTLRVRVVSVRQDMQPDRISMNLSFDVSGRGFRHYTIEQSESFRRHAAAGRTLTKQLDYIRYEGPGKGWIEIDGRVEGGTRVVTSVRLHFDGRGGANPLTIGLKDVRSVDGALKYENELVAHVSLLEFTRSGPRPRMGVHVDSVKRRDAGDNFFQNFKGRFVGMVANMLIDPIAIRKIGNDTMLSFGRALLDRETSFAFPEARNLKTN